MKRWILSPIHTDYWKQLNNLNSGKQQKCVMTCGEASGRDTDVLVDATMWWQVIAVARDPKGIAKF